MATHVDVFNCRRLAEWLDKNSDVAPHAAQFAKSLNAVIVACVETSNPAPGPATKAMLEYARWVMRYGVSINAGDQKFRDFLAEWKGTSE